MMFYDVQVGCAVVPCSEFHGRSCAPQVWQVPALRVGLKPSRSAQHRDAPRHWFCLLCCEFPWIIWSWNWNFMEFHGIPWNSMESSWDAGAQAKQAFHKLPYKSPSEKGHQGSSLSDPIRSYQILSDLIRIPCIPCIHALKQHIASPVVVGGILHAERDARHSCAGVGPQDERFFKSDQDVPRCSWKVAKFMPFQALSFFVISFYSKPSIFWYSLTHFQSERPLDSLNSLPVVGTDSAQHDIKLS